MDIPNEHIYPIAINNECLHLFLSADSLSSALLVGLSKEGRKEEEGRKDYFQSL